MSSKRVPTTSKKTPATSVPVAKQQEIVQASVPAEDEVTRLERELEEIYQQLDATKKEGKQLLARRDEIAEYLKVRRMPQEELSAKQELADIYHKLTLNDLDMRGLTNKRDQIALEIDYLPKHMEEAPPEEEALAETKLNNIAEEITLLRSAIGKADENITSLQGQISRLNEQHEDAKRAHAELMLEDEEFHEREHALKNKLVVTRGTPDEIAVRQALSSVLQRLQSLQLEMRTSTGNLANTELALDTIGTIEQEIARVTSERATLQHRHDEMKHLWQEQHDIIGGFVATELRDEIVAHEETIKSIEDELSEAKRTLRTLQTGIKDRLEKWPERAIMLNAMYGARDDTKTPEHVVFGAWLDFMDSLREHGTKLHIAQPMDDSMPVPGKGRTTQLLALSQDEIISCTKLGSWHMEKMRDMRGNTKWVWVTDRTSAIHALLKRLSR